MKKTLIILGLLLGVSGICKAGTPSLVYQVGISSITTQIITVDNVTPTKVDNVQLAGRVAIEINNMDAAANLWCLPGNSAPASGSGRKIVPGASWSIGVVDAVYAPGSGSRTTTNFWCLTDGGAPTKAAVTQIY